MPFQRIHGGFGGPADVGVGVSRGLLEAAKIRAAQPSPWGNFGQGLGQGFSRGVDLMVQDKYAQKREDRLFDRQDALQDRYDARQDEQIQARQEQFLARQQYDFAQREYEQAQNFVNELTTSGQVVPPMQKRMLDDLESKMIAVNTDARISDGSVDPWQVAEKMNGFKLEYAQIVKGIPRPKSEANKFFSSVVTPEAARKEAMGAGLSEEQAKAMFPDGYLWSKDRSGAYRELTKPDKGSSGSSVNLGGAPMADGQPMMAVHAAKFDPQIRAAVDAGIESPYSFWEWNDKKGTFTKRKDIEQPPSPQEQQEEQVKKQEAAKQKQRVRVERIVNTARTRTESEFAKATGGLGGIPASSFPYDKVYQKNLRMAEEDELRADIMMMSPQEAMAAMQQIIQAGNENTEDGKKAIEIIRQHFGF